MKPTPDLNPQILLVDDNHDGLLVRKSLLEELGFGVQIARHGEEGLKLYEASTFAVVATDYRMPRMDGVQMIAQIRQRNPHARIVLLSGFVEPLGLTAENTGADVVIAKSVHEPAHLVRAVKRLANRTAERKPPATQKGRVSPASRTSSR